MVLKRPLGICSLEDAKTKGLVTVEPDSLIFSKPEKNLTARVLRVLEWVPCSFSQAVLGSQQVYERRGGDGGDGHDSVGNSPYGGSSPLPLSLVQCHNLGYLHFLGSVGNPFPVQ